MWIVRIALKAPYTFTVLAILLMIGGALSTLQMPKDIFPAINIPVVGIIWPFNGMPPQELERRITTVSERALTTTVNNIEHIESNSFNGINVIKVYLQPGASVDAAIAEASAACQAILKSLPAGITPPNILSYNAANVPVLQLSVGGGKFSEQELYDFATNFIRTQLATVQGSSIPLPYGGKTRSVSVDLDPSKLQARNISPQEVTNAINQQSVILPSGTAKIGKREDDVLFNSNTDTIQALNNLPIKEVNGATIYIRDVANVRDGYTPQVNMVLANGIKAAVLPGLEGGGCSTLAVHSLGQTLNIMTLGGLALAVGILVDDATVTIENIHRNLAMGKSLVDGILDGADQIATPAFVATLSICIVFVPIFLLGGVAYYLFAPLAMAVVCAMLASYILSRTVVPTMVKFLLKGEHEAEHPGQSKGIRANWFVTVHGGFNRC